MAGEGRLRWERVAGLRAPFASSGFVWAGRGAGLHPPPPPRF